MCVHAFIASSTHSSGTCLGGGRLNVKPRFNWLSALHGFFLARTALSEAREFVLKILGTLEDALGTDFPERHLD
jgi:hypothetical protein